MASVSRRRCGQVFLFVLLFYEQRSWASVNPSPLLLQEVSEKEETPEKHFSLPNDLYHRSDVFQSEVGALVDRHPRIMAMEVLQAEGLKEAGTEGYHAEMTVVTVEAGGKGPKDDQNMRLLLNFGQHGRELVTSEVALRLLQILAGEYPLGGNVDWGVLYRILPHTTIKIVPMENLNGRKKVEAGDLCERKNGRGVDSNRNWGLDWGKKEKDYDPSEEYPGTAPFSEPETQILRNLTESFKPHVWVNVHSGMEALFMPYDHKNTVPVDGGLQMQALLQILNTKHCDNNCVVGSGGGSVGYLAHGTATDYMYDKLRVPMAFTWEIYGDMTQPESDCFQMFNPATPIKFATVVSKWSAAFLTLIVHLPKSLHSLHGRYPELEVWDWESWPISALPDIPDVELRKRFSTYTDPLLSAGNSDPVETESGRRLGGAEVTKPEEEQLLHDFFSFLGGVLVLFVFFKLCRCYSGVWNPLWYGLLYARGRPIPV